MEKKIDDKATFLRVIKDNKCYNYNQKGGNAAFVKDVKGDFSADSSCYRRNTCRRAPEQ